MKPQTKRSLCLGVFLVIVTLVVLYSYCNGSSVCYTFPLFNGLERDSFQAKPQAEMVVTSVIVQTKQPFNMGTIHKNQGTDVAKIMQGGRARMGKKERYIWQAAQKSLKRPSMHFSCY